MPARADIRPRLGAASRWRGAGMTAAFDRNAKMKFANPMFLSMAQVQRVRRARSRGRRRGRAGAILHGTARDVQPLRHRHFAAVTAEIGAVASLWHELADRAVADYLPLIDFDIRNAVPQY